MVKKSLKHYEITNPTGKGQGSSAEKVLPEASLDTYKIAVVLNCFGKPKELATAD